MQLHAVIVPPPRRGILDRLIARRQAEPPAAPVVTLVPAAPEAVFVRLAKFGNVTATDADGLATALEAVAGTWPAPVLHVSRVRVAEASMVDVAAQLEGDVDALRDIYHNVNEVAQLPRFYLDRRSFRAELALGTVEVEGGAPLPDVVAGAGAPHQGASWSPSHVTLLRTSFTARGTTYAEVTRVELSDGAEESGALAGA